jgi:hypothetical protein
MGRKQAFLQLALTMKIFKNNEIQRRQKKVKKPGRSYEKHEDVPREERSIGALKRRRVREVDVVRTYDLEPLGTTYWPLDTATRTLEGQAGQLAEEAQPF